MNPPSFLRFFWCFVSSFQSPKKFQDGRTEQGVKRREEMFSFPLSSLVAEVSLLRRPQKQIDIRNPLFFTFLSFPPQSFLEVELTLFPDVKVAFGA